MSPDESTRIFLICCVFVALAIYFAIEAWLATHPRCPDCRSRHLKSAHVCPHCGFRFEQASSA